MEFQPRLTRREWLRLLAILPLSGLAAKLMSPGGRRPAKGQGDWPHILILVFDSLSAAHTSLHGYRRETTPHLKQFAARATVYHRHYTAGNFTTPATASLLTGCLPWSHRGVHYAGTVHQQYTRRNLFHLLEGSPYLRLAASHNLLVMNLLDQFQDGLDEIVQPGELGLTGRSIPETFFTNDYNPAYWAESLHRGAPNPVSGAYFLSLINRVSQELHQNQLTRDYSTLFPRGVPAYGKGLYFLPEDAALWLSAFWETAQQPSLVYLHLYPPHEPYTPAAPFINHFDDGWSPLKKPPHAFSQGHSPEKLARLRQEYDEYLAYTDHVFGRIYATMQRSGTIDNTLVVVTSDHGQLFERGIHGHETPTLYEPLMHIPLLIASPGQSQRQDVHSLTSVVDLVPTLLHLAGGPQPPWLEGRVLPGMGGADDPERVIFAVEAKGNPKNDPLRQATLALWQGPYKLIQYQGYRGLNDWVELYHLAEDPQERVDLASALPSVVTELQSLLYSRLRNAEAELASNRQKHESPQIQSLG